MAPVLPAENAESSCATQKLAKPTARRRAAGPNDPSFINSGTATV